MLRYVLALVPLVSVRCITPGPGTTPQDDTASTDTDAPPQVVTLPPLPAPRDVSHGAFATADACTTCHTTSPGSTAMRDAASRDVSPYELWQASMMANAGRDPFWRAMVSAELEAQPGLSGVIQDKCMTCHVPMAHREQVATGAADLAAIWQDDEIGQLGLDGVSCTACHQIRPDGLGTPASFTGGFVIGTNAAIYGPHANPFTNPMQMHTGYLATQGAHITESSLCGSCHTVLTPTFDAQGNALGGVFHEQTPYLEWRASAFSTEGTPGAEAASCQRCHAPPVDEDGASIRTRIARRPDGGDFPPVGERTPYGRHTFVGGNTLVPRILKEQRDLLQPRASDEAFDAHLARVQAFLEDAAQVVITRAERQGDQLLLDVRVTHDAGHKWPSGFPSRRAWLQVAIARPDDAPVFVSGQWDTLGRLIGPDGAPLPSELVGGPVAPHVDVVTDALAIPIWETVMADDAGDPTWKLLAATQVAKDDRLLPRGWNAAHPDAAAILPVGVGPDADFVGGGDTVHYVLTVPPSGELLLRVQFVHQVLGARFAAELFASDTDEVAVFRRYAEQAGMAPAVVAEATAVVP